ncbi:protein of unknown function [Methylocaldum szegediense]|uniref:Uncharacterized protein n=1 Tax=Methylocaldum szegediense TaxID=73780 RepID=A0ABM9HZR4_9GAMM|nr:protein of unknown function [Methylocaldum szegediense]
MRSAVERVILSGGRTQTDGKSVFSGGEKQENADFALQMIICAPRGVNARFDGLDGMPEGVSEMTSLFRVARRIGAFLLSRPNRHIPRFECRQKTVGFRSTLVYSTGRA